MIANNPTVMERDRRLTGTLRGQSDAATAPPGFELSSEWKVGGSRDLWRLVTYQSYRSRRDTFKGGERYGSHQRSFGSARKLGGGGCASGGRGGDGVPDLEDFVYSTNKINAGLFCTEIVGRINVVSFSFLQRTGRIVLQILCAMRVVLLQVGDI